MQWDNLLFQQIRDTFPAVKVYDTKIQQGLETPCFIVRKGRVNHERLYGKQLYLDILYLLTYIPADELSLSEREEDMDRIRFTILSDPAWRYLGEQFHIQDLEIDPPDGNNDSVKIKFYIRHHFEYNIPSPPYMEDVEPEVIIRPEPDDEIIGVDPVTGEPIYMDRIEDINQTP